MTLPFSVDQFFTVFEHYNLSIWPLPVVFYILAIVSSVFIFLNVIKSNQVAFAVLAFYWAWMGLVYHIGYFSEVNPAAYVFGALFIIQGVIFFYVGSWREMIPMRMSLDGSGIIGLILMGYALIVYPLLGYFVGHAYPRTPTFGAPGPTTIFTFGLLFFSIYRIPWYVIIIPLLWSVAGFFAAVQLFVPEDFGLAVAGLLSAAGLLFYKPKPRVW